MFLLITTWIFFNFWGIEKKIYKLGYILIFNQKNTNYVQPFKNTAYVREIETIFGLNL